jgi:hypothetical protein
MAQPSALSLLVTPMQASTTEPTPSPSPAPSPEPESAPGETPPPSFAYLPSAAPDFLPELLLQKAEVLQKGKAIEGYLRRVPLAFGSGAAYAEVDGVLSFRGGNFRDSAAFSSAPHGERKLRIV